MKILGIDPGEKRIGVAISDPTGTIARPLCVIKHVAREADAERIAEIAQAEGVAIIVIGMALNADGEVGHQARKSQRFADVLRTKTAVPVELWDESGTTQAAQASRIALGVPRKKRQGHLDDLAASVLLQDYLIANEAKVKMLEVTDEES
ncbi:MAG: Holliday junction resolvase RuvX [Brevefilum sp.]